MAPRLRGEVRLGQSREEKLREEVRALQRRLDDHARENNRMSKKLEEVESKHVELLSRQQEMMDSGPHPPTRQLLQRYPGPLSSARHVSKR